MRVFPPIHAILLSSVVVLAGCGEDEESVRFSVKVENISQTYDFPASGSFDTPIGETEPGPIGPGMAYEFEFAAAPGTSLSLATMFVMSNDYFYAPSETGISLFDNDGQAISGAITDQLLLWDAGTEINQEPGAGPDQAPNQMAPNTGAADPMAFVRQVSDTFGNLPAVDEVIEVTITPSSGNFFTIRIENVSTPSTLQFTGGESAVLLAPGVWVVHSEDGPLFTPTKAEPGEGLEALAEDGQAQTLAQSLSARTGLTSPIAPGAFALHSSGVEPIFSAGELARGNGLEALAEDGTPASLARALSDDRSLFDSGSFEIPVGAVDPAPAASGESYEFTILARPGDRLSLATMLVQSNDLFFSFGPEGIALFDENLDPVSGVVSGMLDLWDAGTEINEFPGAGPNQAPRQASPNSGLDESSPVALVADGFEYPPAAEFVRVTLTPEP